MGPSTSPPHSDPKGPLWSARFRVPAGQPARPQLLWPGLTSLGCPFTARGSHSGAEAHLDGVSRRAPGASAARRRAREAGARTASALPPCARAGFPDVNRAALQEHSRSAPCVTERALSAQGQHCDLRKQKPCFEFKQLQSHNPSFLGWGGKAWQPSSGLCVYLFQFLVI